MVKQYQRHFSKIHQWAEKRKPPWIFYSEQKYSFENSVNFITEEQKQITSASEL